MKLYDILQELIESSVSDWLKDVVKAYKKIEPSVKNINSKVSKNRFEIGTPSQRDLNCEINEYRHYKQRVPFVLNFTEQVFFKLRFQNYFLIP